MIIAPRAAARFRGRLAGSAKSLGKTASERYRQARARVGEAAREVTDRGQVIRDRVADTVVRGAQKVEQYATEAKAVHHQNAPEPPAQ